MRYRPSQTSRRVGNATSVHREETPFGYPVRIVITKKPLVDWTDADLKRQLRVMTPSTALSYHDVQREVDRRDANRQTRNAFTLSVVATLIALAAVITTAFKS